MIYAAAIKLGDVITFMERPSRHHNIIHSLAEQGHKTPITGTQGFITDKGVFVDRTEGLKIAKENNQIITKHGNPDQLYSEDMW